jgi:ribonuclease P protein component
VTVHFSPVDSGVLPLPGSPAVRVAYAVGRKAGGAVVRNRCRRRLRAIAAEIAPELPPGAYLVKVAPEVTGMHFEELRRRVSETMRTASRAVR